MAKVVISEFMDAAAVDEIAKLHDVIYQPELVDTPEQLALEVSNADALIVRNRTKVTEELLTAAPGLTCIGRLGVGLDNIDLDACRLRNVSVFPATGANDVSVAEYVMTTALMLTRGAYQASSQVAAGTWPRQSLIGGEIAGRTMGLIGFGSIGREVAKRARAFDMKIIAYDPFLPRDNEAWSNAESVDLDRLLSRSDVISLHVPLTVDTRHMIGKTALNAIKNTAFIINTARGGVVDEAALAAALTAGQIAGAALDVFETEPLGPEQGFMFVGLDNIILTPHIAGVTDESNGRVSALTARQVLQHLL